MPTRFNPPLETTRLRALWKASAAGSAERELLLEIARLHHVLVEARALADTIEQCWREEIGGKLVAIHQMRVLLGDEPGVVDWQAKVRVVSP